MLRAFVGFRICFGAGLAGWGLAGPRTGTCGGTPVQSSASACTFVFATSAGDVDDGRATIDQPASTVVFCFYGGPCNPRQWYC